MFRIGSRVGKSVGRNLNISLKNSLRSIVNTTAYQQFEFKTLVEMFIKTCQVNASNYVFGGRVGNKYEWITYSEYEREVQKFRNVLAHLNFGYDDKIAVISNNRLEWAVAAMGAATRGGHIVPMYEAQLEADWRFITTDSDAKILLVANDKIYNAVKDYVGKVGKVQHVISLEGSQFPVKGQVLPESYPAHTYSYWMKKVENEAPVPITNVVPTDLATIIYTSGTTGKPKGVELSHENIVANLDGLRPLWRTEHTNAVSLAFLPWAHVFGQTCELYTLMSTGSAMGIVSNREQILESIGLIKPTMIASVPVLFNKVYDGTMAQVQTQSPLKQKLFFKALEVSRKRNHLLEFGKQPGFFLDLAWKLADKVVLSRVREKFGGRLRFFASGGAATNIKVLEFLEDVGFPVCEGYGLTETSPVISSSANIWELRRLGTCGVVLPNLTVKLLDPETQREVPAGVEGEIVVSGPSVMRGYRNNKQATDEVFFIGEDSKRYFRTGDIGVLQDGKFLKITGRIKEQFKLENGKYVVPAPLEDTISRSKYIAQTFLYGDNKPYTVVLIVPEIAEIRKFCQNFMPNATDKEMMESAEVKALISKEILMMSVGGERGEFPAMKTFERPQKWDYTLELFSQENYMLTAKMSIRRANVLKVYDSKIMAMYGDSGIHIRNDKQGAVHKAVNDMK